jgi:hypothetical protein
VIKLHYYVKLAGKLVSSREYRVLIVPGTCCALRALEREKTINSRQGAKHAKVFGIRTKNNIEVLGDLGASAREKNN